MSRRIVFWVLGSLALLALPAGVALAQSVSIDLGQTGQPGATARLVQLTALIGLLSLAPSLLVMATAFARIVIVLSLLRSAIGAPGIPPNPVLIGLALFLTFFVMAPVFEKAYRDAYVPFSQNQIDLMTAAERGVVPFREFMLKQTRESDLALFVRLSNTPPLQGPEEVPLKVLVPAFIISELKTAFQIGFLVFVPFLMIDLIVASLLMAMGMMMVSPVLVALPFKLMLFVLADGWNLLIGSLVASFGTG